MIEIGFRVAASSLAIALALTTGVSAQHQKGIGGGGGGGGARAPAAAPMARPSPAPMARPSPAPMARPAAPAMRAPQAMPQMRQVAPGPRHMQAPRQFQASPRQMSPRQMSPRQMSPRQAAPNQRFAPRFAGPRDGQPKGQLRRDASPRQDTMRDRGKAGSRAAERRERRQGLEAKQRIDGKSKLTGRENARERAAERRQELIERKQRAAEDRKQRAIERRDALGKDRENLKGREALGKDRDNLNAGRKDRTVGGRTDGRPDRDLVRRGKGDRQWMLRNRALAERSARTPAARALAQSTFGGRFARDWNRRDWRHRHHRHRHIHVIGWLGPVFWPYAYYDFVDYTFWPYAYDSFWPYAYDEVYEGFFGPFAVGGPAYYAEGGYAGGGYASDGVRTGTRTGGGTRTAARGPAGGAAMAQICTGETAGLTDWPIERIAQTVNPDDTQRAALDELRDASARALKVLQSACPDDLPSTPAGRMAAMRLRLEAMVESVRIVRPALDQFYNALNDEQKARFNALEPDQTAVQAKAGKAELSQVCSTAVTKTNAAPAAQIERALRLTSEQKSALDHLGAATDKAAEILAANCPTDETLTPPGRLAGMETRLGAMLQALDVVQPALVDFYDSLTDEQKARFNQLGGRRQASR